MFFYIALHKNNTHQGTITKPYKYSIFRLPIRDNKNHTLFKKHQFPKNASY